VGRSGSLLDARTVMRAVLLWSAAALSVHVTVGAAAAVASVSDADSVSVRAARVDSTERSLPRSALSVSRGDEWREWWRSDQAPRRWAGELAAVAGAVRWTQAAPGLEWGELQLAGSGEAWRLRLVLVRLDPRRQRLALHAAVNAAGRAGPWTVDAAPEGAQLALNAGMFVADGPWGWVVHESVERRPPGRGPLAPAVVVDSAGAVRLVPPDSIEAVRRAGGVREAFQSYPALLVGDGEVPAPLAAAGLGVDVGHRDSRLAIGTLRDGRVLVALTRFEGLGGALSSLPFGPTAPEMAALMGALGAQRAVLLDGGLSGQLLLRDRAGEVRAWRGLRRVPLGLVAMPADGAARDTLPPLTRGTR
jgi:hypothetical protein